jgi:hypothetical protein
MRMKAKERWKCMNPACGCQVVVEIGGEVEGRNPRCACGEIMKKKYTSPAAAYLYFLPLGDRESAAESTGEKPSAVKVWTLFG